MHMNRVILIGNVTKDPELRFAGASQTPVTDIRLAVNRVWKTATGEKREEAVFIDVQFWQRQAETAVQFLKKGRLVAVEGSLAMDEWTDRDGKTRQRMYVRGDRVVFLPDRAGAVQPAEPAPVEGDTPF